MLLFVLLLNFVNLCQRLNAVDELERVFRVPESVPDSASIGFINGQPTEDNSKQNFFIVFPPSIDGKDNGAAEKLLQVDERTGEVALRHGQSLDFERERRLYVLAVPVDGSAPVSVIIQVQDENDNAPQFPVGNVRLEVSEYARINTVLGLPLARDADAPPFDVQRYRIASGNVNNAFRLAQPQQQQHAKQQNNYNNELELVVNGRLDREYRSRYELLIEAIDGGRPTKVGSMRVQIDVLDANDNHPEFVQPRYAARIGPNTAPGIPILRVGAKDPDARENGRVEYGIISQSIVGPQPSSSIPTAPFQLDPQSGTLSLAQAVPPLPHSITFDILIRARDHGVPDALESSTTVEVIVDGTSNVLGETPNVASLSVIWLTDDGTGENVPEGLPLGYVLARVAIERTHRGRAVQEEEQKQLEDSLNLSLLGAQATVCLRQTDSEHIYLLVICGQFDREQTPELRMDLLVRNMSDVLLDHPVRLVLLDINDNAPRWNQSHFQFQWAIGAFEPGHGEEDDSIQNESAERIGADYGNYIRLVATDADAGENGRVRYSTIGTDLFGIEPELGILTLDEDKLPICPMDTSSFQVQAEDHGNPSPLRSRVNITVRFVHAQPAQRVHFAQSVYEVRVAEDAQPGTCVLQVGKQIL
uniref:Cadherin domain-containing protein n=1 Tax=Globodera pallida TaxID=36090 RepID=A0A183BWM2_GLOPA